MIVIIYAELGAARVFKGQWILIDGEGEMAACAGRGPVFLTLECIWGQRA